MATNLLMLFLALSWKSDRIKKVLIIVLSKLSINLEFINTCKFYRYLCTGYPIFN